MGSTKRMKTLCGVASLLVLALLLSACTSMMSQKEQFAEIDKKVEQVISKYKNDFEADIVPFISDPQIAKNTINNFHEDYLKFKNQSFSSIVNLMVKCKKCKKSFYSGIRLNKKSFETMKIENQHDCPFCKYVNIVTNKEYISEI